MHHSKKNFNSLQITFHIIYQKFHTKKTPKEIPKELNIFYEKQPLTD